MDEPEEQINNRPWMYKKGQSGNPGGRPKGSKSMKTYIKEKLAVMTEEEREVFLEGLDKRTIWEMAEGRADAKTELTGKDGKDLIPVPNERIKELASLLNKAYKSKND